NVQIIQRAARRMERLISDLLDVASIESGTLSVRSAPVDLTLLVSEVLELLEGQARERSIKLSSEVDTGIPVIMGRSRPPHAGTFEPPRQCYQVHARRREYPGTRLPKG